MKKLIIIFITLLSSVYAFSADSIYYQMEITNSTDLPLKIRPVVQKDLKNTWSGSIILQPGDTIKQDNGMPQPYQSSPFSSDHDYRVAFSDVNTPDDDLTHSWQVGIADEVASRGYNVDWTCKLTGGKRYWLFTWTDISWSIFEQTNSYSGTPNFAGIVTPGSSYHDGANQDYMRACIELVKWEDYLNSDEGYMEVHSL